MTHLLTGVYSYLTATELTAPVVPDSGAALMPEQPQSFAQGIREVLFDALGLLRPDLKEAAGVCVGILIVAILISLVRSLPGSRDDVTELVGTIAVTGLLLKASNALINLASQTIAEISEYGKLLLPVMTTALAAQGGVTTSAALYGGTAAFNSFLSNLISILLVPLTYLILGLSVANSALQEDSLGKLRDGIKGWVVWLLRLTLYIFTGYISITGVVSGTTDASMLKAAKITISGFVPVVGGILSDASEAVLVSAGTVKNAAGIYGMLAVLAVWLGPFLKIGLHYLMLKATGGICGIFGSKKVTQLVQDFSVAMGLLLAMTGTVCLMLMISTVCFLRGVN